MSETQASLKSGLRWNLEIENNAGAGGNALLPNAAEAGAEIVSLHAEGDMRAPLDVHTAAAHDCKRVKRRSADGLAKAVMRAAN